MNKYITLLFLLFIPVLGSVFANEPDTTYESDPEALIEYQVKNAAEILGGVGVLNNLGTLDPLTKAHLFANRPQVLGVTTELFTKNLVLGVIDLEVKRLQEYLNANGFTVAPTGPGSKGQETTYFGPATAVAVKKYQEANRTAILTPNNLSAGTGLFLGGTREHLNKRLTTATTSGSVAAVPKPVTSVIKPAGKTYTVSLKQTGRGTITASDGQTCSTQNCVFVVAQNTKVTLKAVAITGEKFVRWGGSCKGTRTSCALTVKNNISVTASFKSSKTKSSGGGGGGGGGSSTPAPTVPEVSHTLTAAVSGSGTVTGGVINCPASCITTYTNGTSVTLTAAPSTGHTFAGWSGACSGTNSTCTVSMTESRVVNASFTANPAPDPEETPTASSTYDLAAAIADVPFSVSLPTAPTITSEVIATTEAEIIASLGVNGRRTIVAPGSYTFDSITVGGNNKEIVFQSGANFTLSAFYLINASAIALENAVLNTSGSHGLRVIDSQDLRFEGLTLNAADSGFNLSGSSRLLFLSSSLTGYAHPGWIDAGNSNLVMANSEFISNQPWGGINGWSVRWSGNGTPNTVAMDSRYRAVQNVVLRYEESQSNGYFARNQIEGNNPFRTEGRDGGTPSAWPLDNLHFVDNNIYPLSAGDGSVIVSSYPRMTNVTATGNRTIGPISTTNVGFPSGQATWTLSGNTHTLTGGYQTPPVWEMQ